MAAKTWEQRKIECEAVAKPGITILGFIGESCSAYSYLVCHCALHGQWSTTSVSNFLKGTSCPYCGNSRKAINRRKGWEEYEKECKEKSPKHISILGWVAPWRSCHTRLHCLCSVHGEWKTTSIVKFKAGVTCPKCAIEKRLADSAPQHIKEFMETGKFLEGTTFKIVGKRGSKIIWEYTCPKCSNDMYVTAGVCSGRFRSQTSNLKAGKLTCRCSSSYKPTPEQRTFKMISECRTRGYTFLDWIDTKPGRSPRFRYLCSLHGEQESSVSNFTSAGSNCPSCGGQNQKECYINIVYDGSIPVALKFGIAQNSSKRLRVQNRKNLLSMRRICLFVFPTVYACKGAELECKTLLDCGVMSERDLPDGRTETVALTDYDKVVSIYERFGGVRVDTLTEEISNESDCEV